MKTLSTIHELFDTQKQYLDFFFEKVDVEQAEVLIEKLVGCKGVIYCSGVGKSAIVGQKIAHMLMSIGKKAQFISAVDGVHGDLGAVGPGDCVILMSKSGSTKELVDLVPFIKKKQAETIGWVCSEHSKLEKLCDYSIYLPMTKELCPFDLAPTTSSAIQMIFGDILVVGMMHRMGFSKDDYAWNHPAGSIGKKLVLTVGDLMLQGSKVPIADKKTQLKDCLEILTQGQSGCVVVVDEHKRLEGLFTDGDLRRALLEKGEGVIGAAIEELMTENPVCIQKEMLAVEALRVMQKEDAKWISQLPVTDEGVVVGLVRMHDIVQEGLV